MPFADPGERAASNAELTGKMPELSATASPLMLLSGTANRGLAERISEELDRPLCDVTIKRFADGEIFVGINENVRGRDVFLIQPTSPPAANILELLLLIDAAANLVRPAPCRCYVHDWIDLELEGCVSD